MSDEYKKYDSDDKYVNWAARLAKDPDVKEGDSGKFVRLTIVSTSRAESDTELWIEVTPTDRQADMASYLKKGDTLGIEGKPTVRKGKDGEKLFFNLRRAELHPSPALLKELKDRGWNPAAAAARKNGVPAKTVTRPATATQKKVVQLDDDE